MTSEELDRLSKRIIAVVMQTTWRDVGEVNTIVADIAAAIREARIAGLEEAEQLAVSDARYWLMHEQDEKQIVCERFAEELRTRIAELKKEKTT